MSQKDINTVYNIIYVIDGEKYTADISATDPKTAVVRLITELRKTDFSSNIYIMEISYTPKGQK